MLFLSFILGFIVGIGGGSLGNWRHVIFLLIIPLCAFLFFRGKNWLFFMLAIAGILLGGHMSIADYANHIDDWKKLTEITGNGTEKVYVIGKVSGIAYTQDLRTIYRLKIDTIANISTGVIKEDFSQQDIGIFTEIPNNLTVKDRDTLAFTGKISPTLTFPLEGFERYALSQRAYGKIFLSTFSRVPTTDTSLLDRIRDWSLGVIFRGFPRDIAGVLLGMMIGRIEFLSADVKDAFILSGTSHILVVSGSNIAFVILLITGVLKYFPIGKVGRIMSVTFFILFYSTLVGWDTSVIRATCMGIITFFAIEQGKRTSSIAILFGTAFVLLLVNPLMLAYDAGFGLSFGATIGILLYYESFQGLLQKGHIPKVLIPLFGVTLAASLGSLPVMIYHFGAISASSLVANILIAGVLGWILIAGVFYLLLAVIGGYILYLFGFLVYIPTQYVLLVSRFFALGGNITISDGWQAILCVGMLGYFLIEVFMHEEDRITPYQKA